MMTVNSLNGQLFYLWLPWVTGSWILCRTKSCGSDSRTTDSLESQIVLPSEILSLHLIAVPNKNVKMLNFMFRTWVNTETDAYKSDATGQ